MSPRFKAPGAAYLNIIIILGKGVHAVPVHPETQAAVGAQDVNSQGLEILRFACGVSQSSPEKFW